MELGPFDPWFGLGGESNDDDRYVEGFRNEEDIEPSEAPTSTHDRDLSIQHSHSSVQIPRIQSLVCERIIEDNDQFRPKYFD